jgi:FAD/FMN-containing dehydrogenase
MTMSGGDSNVIEALAAIVGAKGLVTDATDMAPWCSDWRGRYHGKALCIVSPASTAEVSRVVALADERGVALVPQGGNTGTVGGATPSADGHQVILSLRRMNAIRTLDPANNIAVVEAGVILENLHNAAASAGRRFPLSLAAKGSATVGGLVSTNAGGTQVLRFGTMRALVLGLEVVLPDGQIHNGLSVLSKDNRGYDLTQLMIGAEGTLGIVTAASLRLVPAIADSATTWIGVDNPETALAMLRAMEAASGSAIESFEIIAAKSLAAVLTHVSGTRAPLEGDHAWHVLIDYVGQGAAPALEALVASAIENGQVQDAVIAANSAQAAAFWNIRESLSAAEKATGPAVQHDLSVPVAAMPGFILSASAAVEAEFAGTTAIAFGHLGDGNVHFHVRSPAGSDPATWRNNEGEIIAKFVHDLVISAGGSISAEHGIGQSLRAELLRLSSPARITALRAIKAALDPQGIMNPGKLVPLASDAPAA